MNFQEQAWLQLAPSYLQSSVEGTIVTGAILQQWQIIMIPQASLKCNQNKGHTVDEITTPPSETLKLGCTFKTVCWMNLIVQKNMNSQQ